jgi:two-component system, NtrC family, nitrogen regulation response regulator NtrX
VIPDRPEIVALSPAMRAALDGARLAATTDGGVLICGEGGSGRRMLASEIHHLSAGPAAPFVTVDCGELVGIDSALFGVSGPSDGDRDRPGLDRISNACLLHQAVGGTLFLANVPEMPSRTQARLARILRDCEVTIVESCRSKPIRLRLIASSDDAWELAVAEGQIRGDLSKRCCGSRIDVPPLRDRREDIPRLACAMLTEVCAEHGLEPKTVEGPAMALLCAMPWRSNAQEMRALLSSLANGLPGPQIRLDDILNAVRLDGSAKTPLASGTLREAKERFERDYIISTLERHRGRIADAAEALGIQRPNLYRKMRALRVPTPRQVQD